MIVENLVLNELNEVEYDLNLKVRKYCKFLEKRKVSFGRIFLGK